MNVRATFILRDLTDSISICDDPHLIVFFSCFNFLREHLDCKTVQTLGVPRISSFLST